MWFICQVLTYAAIEPSEISVLWMTCRLMVLPTVTADSSPDPSSDQRRSCSSIPKMHPEEVYCSSRARCSVTHLHRKLKTSGWAPDDDLYLCQRGLLPTKCLVWPAQCQLIKSHARTVTVRGEQGVLFFLTSPLTLFLLSLGHWCPERITCVSMCTYETSEHLCTEPHHNSLQHAVSIIC